MVIGFVKSPATQDNFQENTNQALFFGDLLSLWWFRKVDRKVAHFFEWLEESHTDRKIWGPCYPHEPLIMEKCTIFPIVKHHPKSLLNEAG